ncbi:uncharacterized protein BO72DRAFT_482373 [Aspergillus fijiensis CBS 313.89]|uniref:Uncharacterized protein n=1 Tax=Aspergillus fijiensis CBS 313.89 TaxID=1448319 RepID=A0A8G1W3S3_9EURO|nr:uncharacterized protein BO72DRAFT_482373 [Aspergillus fijiensis CBS 313.89]RAK82742.1 hypothetical protein BO72DRAFT_482373 [Aspergillus fijiensis CBS 313.89]
MAKSPRGNKQRAAVAAAGSDEKAASSSFLAELDHALESRPVSWLQAVESLSQNPSTEPPGHGITKSIEQTTIHHNTDQKDNNTAGCDESNTAYDKDISDFESIGASSQEDVSVDKRSRTEAIDLLRARTATRSTPTSSPTPTPSTPVVTVVDTTPANAVDSSHLPPTSSSTENPAFEQSASLSVASSPKVRPSKQ